MYIQRGRYEKYPQIIEDGNIWNPEEKPPQWLTDQGKIIKITESGNYIFDTGKNTTGETIYKNQSGGVLATLPKEGYLIYSNKTGIIGITKKQLELLYKKEKEA